MLQPEVQESIRAKSDFELEEYVGKTEYYLPEAIEFARAEIERRGLSVGERDQLHAEVVATQRAETEEVLYKPVSQLAQVGILVGATAVAAIAPMLVITALVPLIAHPLYAHSRGHLTAEANRKAYFQAWTPAVSGILIGWLIAAVVPSIT